MNEIIGGSQTSMQRLAWGLLASWLGVLGVWLFALISLSEIEVAMVLYGVFATGALLYLGKGRLTAWLGASAIGVGAFAFISEIIMSGLFGLIAPIRLLALALIFTGIVLERASPTPTLQPWMLMLIAAKVEFIIVSSLMVSVLAIGHTLFEMAVLAWWVLVFLMVVSAVPLAYGKELWYRVVWYVMVLVSVALLIALLSELTLMSLATLWAVAATLWPPIAVRLVHHKSTT